MSADEPTRIAEFHYLENFQGKGPRVVLLAGQHWTESMRRHYGITRAPFYIRRATTAEPSRDASGHPWGWISKPEELLLDEQRWSDEQTMNRLRSLLDTEIARTKEFA